MVEFGLEVPQGGLPWPMCLEFAKAADRLGYHSLWLSDHMWIPGLPDLDYHEAIAMMGALAACTEKVRLGTIVLCNSYRNPALLAKSLVTIDHVSNGRLEIGLGAGWMEEEYRAYGYEFPPPASASSSSRRACRSSRRCSPASAPASRAGTTRSPTRRSIPSPSRSPIRRS